MGNENAAPPGRKDGWLEIRLGVRARGSRVPRELAGVPATFLTLSCILFVQPFVMSLALPEGVSTEALPAFLCITIMPLTISITDGIAFSSIAHVILKVFADRYREVKPFVALCAALLALRYLFLWPAKSMNKPACRVDRT